MNRIITAQSELNMRSKPRKDVDQAVFNNPDYIIFKKNYEPIDQLRFAPDMLAIGSSNLNLRHDVFGDDHEAFGLFLDEVQGMINTKIEMLRKAAHDKRKESKDGGA